MSTINERTREHYFYETPSKPILSYPPLALLLWPRGNILCPPPDNRRRARRGPIPSVAIGSSDHRRSCGTLWLARSPRRREDVESATSFSPTVMRSFPTTLCRRGCAGRSAMITPTTFRRCTGCATSSKGRGASNRRKRSLWLVSERWRNQ